MKYFITLATLLLSLCGVRLFAAPFPATYPAEVIKIIDGDTIKVRIEIYPDIFKVVNVRVAGIDTPETRRGSKNGQPITDKELTLGKAAATYAATLFDNNKNITVTHLDPSKTKYAGRINGLIWVNDQSYAQLMLNKGFALPYHGGKRPSWK